MANKANVMGFFVACRNTDIMTAKELLKHIDPSSLLNTKWEERTCFHVAVIAGDPDLFRELAAKLPVQGCKSKMKEADKKGDTALHLAARKNRVDLVKQLVKLDPNLCDFLNNERETPLKLAASLGFKKAVEFLITCTSNALHYVVELNQVKLVQFLMERSHGKLSELINKPYQLTTNHPERDICATNSSAKDGIRAGNDHPIVVSGDTPLHIAARNRYDHMVNLLLKVRGVDKSARNSEDKTPYEIAREVTEYHESFRVIRKLADCERNPKAFMECVPQVSNEKRVRARKGVEDAYKARRDAELVVAGLLATMTCAAAFTVPGGFESNNGAKDRGSPNLVSLVSFKLFLIFDCVSFFLSLFVCIMWEMSCELTTGDKMLFMTINSLVVCFSFGFTTYGFMCAVYVMLQRKVKTFSWVVLGTLIAITFWAHVAFFHQSAHFVVKRARFHRLCGVSRLFDDMVEKVWSRLERCGLLRRLRSGDDVSQDLITGHAMCCGLGRFLRSDDDVNTSGSTHEHEASHNNSPLSATYQLHSRSASPLLNRTR